MTARRLLAAAAAALLAGCGGDTKSAATPPAGAAAATPSGSASGTPRGTAGAPGATPGAATAPNGCPHDGRWRPCSLVDRLEKAGLVVKPKPDTVRYDFLSVPGRAYEVGRGEIQAFFYDDTTRLAKDVAALDTVEVAPKGTLRHWDVHPTFARSANLVVIVLTLSEVLMERGALAIQGGPPQPDPPPEPQQLPAARAP